MSENAMLVSVKLLEDLLRLPKGVRITDVEWPDGRSDDVVSLTLDGPAVPDIGGPHRRLRDHHRGW